MRHDEDNVDEEDRTAPDLARTRHERGLEASPDSAKASITRELREDPEPTTRDDEKAGSPRSKELIHAADVLVSATEDELMDAGLSVIGSMHSYQWEGMLPPAREFNGYDAPTRERICRWNDAFTVDESARQDLLVQNEIRQQERSMNMTFVLMAGFGMATFVSFLVTRDALSFAFLSVPILNFIGSLLKPVFSKSSRGDDSSNKD